MTNVNTAVETPEAMAATGDRLPHLSSFPQKAQSILGGWIARLKEVRTLGLGLEDLKKEIKKALLTGYMIDAEFDYAHLWACNELFEAAQSTLTGASGEAISPIDLETIGNYLTNRGLWPELEETIGKGESVFAHATTPGTFQDILQQGELTSRSRQNKPRFNTKEYKSQTRELYDLSFAWDDHSGRFGSFAFVVPTDLALRDSVFCEADGIHVMNKTIEAGYSYSLEKPYVVIVPHEIELSFGSGKFAEFDIDANLAELGWSKAEIAAWKEKHLVVANSRDGKENRSIQNGTRVLTYDSWNLRRDQTSPLKMRVLEKLKAQGYFPTKKQFLPTGEKNNLGTDHEFWLYELK